MIPYELGEVVTIQLGDRLYSGKVTGLSAQSLEVTFPVELDLGFESATLRWPGQRIQHVAFGAIKPQTHLVLKLPIDSVPQREVAPSAPALEEPLSYIQAEMRRSVRVPIELAVRLEDPQTAEVISGETQDLSSGGMRVLVRAPLVVGREYAVILPLGEAETEVRARVLRRLSGEVYAVKFLCEREVGHRLMRMVFDRVRGNQPSAQSRRMNFKRV